MKRKIALAVVLLMLFAMVSGCSVKDRTPDDDPSEESSVESVPEEPEPEPVLSPEEEYLQTMTLEEKIGQLFFLAFRQYQSGNLSVLDDESQPLSGNITILDKGSISVMNTIQPGGVILFKENVQAVDQVRTWISDAKETTRCPMFVSVDQEGGQVQRLAENVGATRLPDMYEIGKTGDAKYAEKAGEILASELSVFGFNMDFAPVSDVYSNPSNRVIGTRAFSRDPEVAAEMSVAAAKGMLNNGIIPVAKHFPGHGDTSSDTHTQTVVVRKNLDELWETELIPFKSQIENGIPAVMIAHITLPQLDEDYPASLSKAVVTDLLREEMGYDGVVITDALNMRAISDLFSSADACIAALNAGVDMLLMPEDPMAAYEGLIAAVKEGEIPESRIDESVLRILKLKFDGQLFEERELRDPSVLGCEEHLQFVSEVRKAGVK